MQILADRFGVDGVVNTGIAGSLKAEINIGVNHAIHAKTDVYKRQGKLGTGQAGTG